MLSAQSANMRLFNGRGWQRNWGYQKAPRQPFFFEVAPISSACCSVCVIRAVGHKIHGIPFACPVLFLTICLILFWRHSSAKEYDPGHSRLGSFNGRPKMKKLALIMLAAASLLATAGLAPAQYYYGGGYYYPGYRYGYPGQYYRYYHGGYYRGRGYGYGGAIIGHNSWGQPEVWYPVRWGGRCPRGYTVQDGVCKLYRGY